MKNSSPIKITYGAAQKIKKGLATEKRKPKNQHFPNLAPSTHDSGFWAVIEGRTTERPVSITDDNLQLGCYKWNRVQSKTTSADALMQNLDLPGNFFNAQRILDYADVFEGDFVTDEQDNFAVEFAFASQYVLPGDVVFLRPSLYHNYYVFEYNPLTRFCVIMSDVTAAAVVDTHLVFGTGQVKPINVEDNDGTLEGSFRESYEETGEDWTLTIKNGFRTEISATEELPVIGQISYSAGYWWLIACECEGTAFEEIP